MSKKKLKTIRSSCLKTSPSVLLTLLSIIIGVSLEHLLGNLFDIMTYHPEDIEYIGLIARSGISFLILFLIWFDYVWSILFFRWEIGFIDSLLLFLIIVPQFLSFNYLNSNNLWSIGACATSFVGIFSYYNHYRHIKKIEIITKNSNKEKVINKLIQRNQKFCIVITAIVFIFSFTSIVAGKFYDIPSISLPLIILIGTTYKLIVSYRFFKVVSFSKSIRDMSFGNLFKFRKAINT